MPKFLVTNLSQPNDPNLPLGGNTAINFMEPQLLLAAQEAGFEAYTILYRSLEKRSDGAITADIVRIKFNNPALIKRILESEESLEEMIAVSNLTLEEGQKHDPKKLPISLGRIENLRILGNTVIIQHLQKIAHQEPAIEFDPSTPIIERTRETVDLKSFLAEPEGENVFYLRGVLRENISDITPWLLELEEMGVKFPVHPHSLTFGDKQIVIDEPQLRKHSLISQRFSGDDVASIISFYRQHCESEGMVLKPHFGWAGHAIRILKPHLEDAEIIATIEDLKQEATSTSYFATLQCDELIAQKRLNNLHKDDIDHELLAGDIRFTSINGNLVGAALRYSDDPSEKPLSYERTVGLLPNDLTFNEENIRHCIATSEGNHKRQQYFSNLLDVYHTAQDVTSWCKDHGHFHIGFDVLMGRDSEGNWRYCLTELNNIWPDCIPETNWINRKTNAAVTDVCELVVDLAKRGNFITPSASRSVNPQTVFTLSKEEAKKLEEEQLESVFTIGGA